VTGEACASAAILEKERGRGHIPIIALTAPLRFEARVRAGMTFQDPPRTTLPFHGVCLTLTRWALAVDIIYSGSCCTRNKLNWRAFEPATLRRRIVMNPVLSERGSGGEQNGIPVRW
jgi:hypothetical protein